MSILLSSKKIIEWISNAKLPKRKRKFAHRVINALELLELQIGYLLQLESQEKNVKLHEALVTELNEKFEKLQRIIQHQEKEKLDHWFTDYEHFHLTFQEQMDARKHALHDAIQHTIRTQSKIRRQEIIRLFLGFITVLSSLALGVGIFMGLIILTLGTTFFPPNFHLRALASIAIGAFVLSFGVIGLHYSFKFFPSLERIPFPRHAKKINPVHAHLAVKHHLRALIHLLKKT